MGAQLFVQTPEEFQAWINEQQQLASNEGMDKAVAANPSERSSSELLAPYAKEMGIDSQTLEQLHSTHKPLAHHLAVSNQL